MEQLTNQNPRSYSLYFILKLWFRARNVIGTFEKRAPGPFPGSATPISPSHSYLLLASPGPSSGIRGERRFYFSLLLASLFPISSINAHSGWLASCLFQKQVDLLSRLSGSTFFLFPFFFLFSSHSLLIFYPDFKVSLINLFLFLSL